MSSLKNRRAYSIGTLTPVSTQVPFCHEEFDLAQRKGRASAPQPLGGSLCILVTLCLVRLYFFACRLWVMLASLMV